MNGKKERKGKEEVTKEKKVRKVQAKWRKKKIVPASVELLSLMKILWTQIFYYFFILLLLVLFDS